MAVTGQVARILSDESIVINRGSEHGVKPGDRFVVFAAGDEVTDPESGASLGRLEIVKARVAAAHVQENMTTCVAEPEAESLSFEDPTQHTLSAEMVAVSMSSGRGLAGRRKAGKMEVDRSAASGVPRAGPVAVGDRVRSV
jgi:hypothetical protein